MVVNMGDEFVQFDFDDIVAASTNETSAVVVTVTSQAERLQYLIDNTPAIIYTSVPTGDFKMTFVSENAYHVLGYRPEDMVADPNFWFDHIHPDDVPKIFSSIAMLFSEGKQTYEYRFKSSNGEYVWMHDMLKLIRDDAGKPLEVVGSLTDITKRKQMESDLQKQTEEQRILILKLSSTQKQLVEAEKMASVGQLAAGVAHEINNPIGFVNSNMGTLQIMRKHCFLYLMNMMP
jgi:two-component system NtrC family sensor kinase